MLSVYRPLGEWAHELHLFTLKVLQKADFEEYRQDSSRGEEGWSGVDITKGIKDSGWALGASPFFSVRLHEKEVLIFLRLLNRLMASPLSGWELTL